MLCEDLKHQLRVENSAYMKLNIEEDIDEAEYICHHYDDDFLSRIWSYVNVNQRRGWNKPI